MASGINQKGEPAADKLAVECYAWMESFIPILIFTIILFTMIFRIVQVSGPSMVPTLQSGDRVILFSGYYQPKQGDIVVFQQTSGIKQPIIKRIIALENQTVDIDFQAGTVSVDGQVLDESAYIQNGITKQPSDFEFPMVVPPGHVFVLGDNRRVSDDSRSSNVGMVDVHYIMGKAQYVLSPFNRMGLVK